MNDTTVFVTGITLTAAACALVVATLDRPLRRILVELCGTQERALFWAALSRITLVAVPLIFALHFHPEPDADVPVLLALATQLKWALVGVVTAVVVLGMVLSSFITKMPPAATAAPAAPPARGIADRYRS